MITTLGSRFVYFAIVIIHNAIRNLCQEGCGTLPQGQCALYLCTYMLIPIHIDCIYIL